MAEKKFLDLTGLQKYDTKIKGVIDEKNTATLTSAKAYADGLASNYDAAGSAATAKSEAIAHADTEVAKANKAAQAAQTQADKGVNDAATAQSAANKAQSEVDALETFVGKLPLGEDSGTVIAYIDKKTSGIASSGQMEALTNRVQTNEGDITKLKGRMDTAENNHNTLEPRVTAVEGKANANDSAIKVLNGTGEGSVKKQVDDALNAFATNVSNDNVVNTYKELIDYCATHGSEAAQMAGNIEKNTGAITKLETLVGKLPLEGTQAKDVIGYVDEKVGAEKSRAEGIENGLNTRLQTVEKKFTDGAEISGSVANLIGAAKQEAIDAAAEDATTKANNAKTNAVKDAKTYTDTEVGKVNTKADSNATAITALQEKASTLEGKAHTHTNKEQLDLLDAIKMASIDSAIAKSHEHSNSATLAKITEENLTSWSNAEQNAKSYVDGKIAEFVAISAQEIDALFAPVAVRG